MTNKNLSTPGSFISYPEVKVSDIEFGIILRSYKVRIKLASAPSENIVLTSSFSNLGSSIISSVRRSVDMPCFLPPHYFSFHVQMEKKDPLVGIEKEVPSTPTTQQDEVCCLYLTLKEDAFLLTKCSVNVVCGCKPEVWKNPMMTNEYFIDCANEPLTEISASNPFLMSRHQHDYCVHGLQQEYYLSISVFDFSKASVVPLEAQRIIAKRKCTIQLRPHIVKEWSKPYDVTIKCKGGYGIGAHKNVLTARSPVFKSMLESDFKEAKSNTIHVMDLNAPAMLLILHFIYTGELGQNWMEVPVEEIVYGADKYNLPELLKFFDHLMIFGCNYQNALRLHQLAERHSLVNAQHSILGFIEKNLGAVFSENLELKAKRM